MRPPISIAPPVLAFVLVLGLVATPRSVAQPLASSFPVEETLARLTLEEKLGQLILPRIGGGPLEGSAELEELLELAKNGRIGGAVVFAGDVNSTARTLARLREISPVAPLIALDAETGAAMRLAGASSVPTAMRLGAAGDEGLAHLAGRITAEEALRLGIGMVLAPVLDLALEPSNRVIGNRSFGSDPREVARLASAWIRGAEEAGAVAVAKHFPGHGATLEDSHRTLATLEVSADALRRRELVPFRAAVAAGVDGVMPGHIAVPALEDPELPASRSALLLRGVLRSEMGFAGLVVSDALEMTGSRQGAWDGAAAVEALHAGVDVLLVPPDPRVTWRALRDAVRRGDLTEERVDDSVRRILEAKARIARGVERARATEPTARSFGSAGLAWVTDPKRSFPLGAVTPRVLLLQWRDPFDRRAGSGPAFRAALERRAAEVRRVSFGPGSLPSSWLELAPLLEEEWDLVVWAHHGWARELPAGLPASTAARTLCAALERRAARGPPTVLVAFQEAWAIEPFLQGDSGFSCAPGMARLAVADPSAEAQGVAAQALFGEVPVSGRLPVPVGAHPAGRGLLRPAAESALADAREPAELGFSAVGLAAARTILEDAVAEGVTPGAVALVARHGRIVLHEAVGRSSYEEGASRVERDTIYDLASLTKVVATTTLAMILVDRGLLDLDARVRTYLPEWRAAEGHDIRVSDLLAHSSGALWWTDLYARHGDRRGEPTAAARRGYLEEIYATELGSEPRSETRYSDLGILLLGEILERVGGRALDELARREIFAPLGMTETGYRPAARLRRRIAPTEVDADWRGGLVHGAVHDENAFGLGGVAAHAGLFATAEDLARFCQMLLNGGHFAGRRLLRAATIDRFTARAERVAGSSRALGWDTPSPPSSSGRHFSARSYGHTGFTGTSIWIDPERQLFVILLTNRVHPTRENVGIRQLRPAFHDAVMEALVGVEGRPDADAGGRQR